MTRHFLPHFSEICVFGLSGGLSDFRLVPALWNSVYHILTLLQKRTKQHSSETFARVSHDSREIFVRASHDSRETFVRVSHDIRANLNQFHFSQLHVSLEMVLFMLFICRIVQIAETSLRCVCERLRSVGDGLATGSRHMQ